MVSVLVVIRHSVRNQKYIERRYQVTPLELISILFHDPCLFAIASRDASLKVTLGVFAYQLRCPADHGWCEK